MAVGKLKIGDKKLKIKSATISESFCKDGHPFWDIDVDAGDIRFYSEEMPVDAPGLDEIVGKTVEIEEEYDEYGEPNISVYFDEHQETWGHKIKFLARKGGKLWVKWTGVCEHFRDELPFEMKVDFTVS